MFLYQFITRSILEVRVEHVDRFTVTNLSYIFIIQLLLPATSHYCQYSENGTRLISIATVSQISSTQHTQRYATPIVTAYFTTEDLFFCLSDRSLYIHRATGNSIILSIFSYVRAQSETVWKSQKSLPEDYISYDFLLDRVSGATGSEIHREIKWPGKRRNRGNNSRCRQCYAW